MKHEFKTIKTLTFGSLTFMEGDRVYFISHGVTYVGKILSFREDIDSMYFELEEPACVKVLMLLDEITAMGKL